MFGVISNFSWTFENDGSYSVRIDIISMGDVIESLKVNIPITDKDAITTDFLLGTKWNEQRESQQESVAILSPE